MGIRLHTTIVYHRIGFLRKNALISGRAEMLEGVIKRIPFILYSLPRSQPSRTPVSPSVPPSMSVVVDMAAGSSSGPFAPPCSISALDNPESYQLLLQTLL